jgi:hypothetical protein
MAFYVRQEWTLVSDIWRALVVYRTDEALTRESPELLEYIG